MKRREVIGKQDKGIRHIRYMGYIDIYRYTGIRVLRIKRVRVIKRRVIKGGC